MVLGFNRVETSVYRYRLTVEVQTPEGLRAGSSTQELVYRRMFAPTPETLDNSARVRGEAVAVDLPGGVLFALLRSDARNPSLVRLLRTAFAPAYGNITVAGIDDIMRAARQSGEAYVLQRHRTYPDAIRSGYPILARFTDPADPKSIEIIDPENLEASFGAGIRLIRISIQITDLPRKLRVERSLPSFGPETGWRQWYQSLPLGDPRQVTRDDFITEHGI